MFDLVISGGSLVDGTGAAQRLADIGIKDGRIVAVESSLAGADAAETIDASGRVVTPGFVDIHTHYDGQVTWDPLLEPTSCHGVTTIVAGNCGVGFAPVKPGSEEWLVQLMEGVEDIPGTALHEGIEWGWETFPQYLDALSTKRWSMDVAAYVPHGPVRAYVMGDRGARNEAATADDIEAMARIVRESIEAGAVGFSTSRTLAHRAKDGEPVPGTYAAMDELDAIADAMLAGGGGLFEVAPLGLEMDPDSYLTELAWMERLALRVELPVSYLVLQNGMQPHSYRSALSMADRVNGSGGRAVPQVAGRPFGMMLGWGSYHPFAQRPTYLSLASRMHHAELVGELARPEIRAAILSEPNGPAIPGERFGGIAEMFLASFDRIFACGFPLDYEPTADQSIAALAAASGVTAEALAYDVMMANGGEGFMMFPFFNYAEGNHDSIHEMLTHPATVSSLSDGGAHCRMICDASIPTYLLTHWVRDRTRGARLSLEQAVKMQTADTAAAVGFLDRGVVATGKRADLNVIDMGALTLGAPRTLDDLPAGGRRLVQGASGYTATIVAGAVTRRDGVDTGARPGRLVRAR